MSVVNALSERLEVEVARGGQLYRQIYQRGKPKAGLEKLGKIANRRGTKVRFKPDEQIFGQVKFNPQRVFKMARAKAYLFGGVEIRWNCDPNCSKASRASRPRRLFISPKGSSDYLAGSIKAQRWFIPTFLPASRKRRRPRQRRMGGGVRRRHRRIPLLLLQHNPDAGRWHA